MKTYFCTEAESYNMPYITESLPLSIIVKTSLWFQRWCLNSSYIFLIIHIICQTLSDKIYAILQGVIQLEKELANLGGVCAAALMKKDLALPIGKSGQIPFTYW